VTTTAVPDDSRGVVDLLGDAVRPGRWSSIRLYSAPRTAPRARRPTDVVQLALAASVVLALASIGDDPPTGFGAAIADVGATMPHVLGPVWRFFVDALVVWAVLLLLFSVVRTRWALVRDQAAALAVALGAAALTSRVVSGAWPSITSDIAGADGVVRYPALSLALGVAALSVTAPHLTRPFRYAARWLAAGAFVATLTLGVATPAAAVGGYALGLVAAAIVHLVVGSPGGRPSAAQVAAGLADLRVDAAVTGPVTPRAGVALAPARGLSGIPLLVKVYGRDAWDGQLLAALSRFVLYRDGARMPVLTRVQQVDHEAVLTLLAERRGAAVAPVIAVGRAAHGDALLVLHRPGVALSDVGDADIDDDLLDRLWESLDRLHRAGIVHGQIDASTLLVDDGELPRITDLVNAQATFEPERLHGDRAQLIVTTALGSGIERAVAAATRSLPADALAAASSYVQPAALPRALRQAARERDLDLDDLRAATAHAAGVEPPELPRLRRVTWGSVLTVAMLLIAGWLLVSALTDVGLDTMADALRAASWPIVVIAFVAGQLPRFANALSVLAAAPAPMPFARVAALQFAGTFVNLAMPSTAARIAVNVRFFQRAGVPAGTAVAVGAVDGAAGFVSQMLLLGTVLLFGAGSLDFVLDDRVDFSRLAPLLLALGAFAVLVVTVFTVVPQLRQRVVDVVRPALAPLTVLRSPRRLVRLVACNLLSELLFAATMLIVLRAFGQAVPFADVVVINVAVALFAGLMPVPGGIGVTEAALTAGFVAAGVPDGAAFAAALTYRLVTYYAPPLLGFFAMRWLQRNQYL
jgi:uncharacterized protein (TIRG00374 family)